MRMIFAPMLLASATSAADLTFTHQRLRWFTTGFHGGTADAGGYNVGLPRYWYVR